MKPLKIKAGQLKLKVFEVFGYGDPTTKEVLIQGLVREALPSETTKIYLKRLGKKLQDELTTIEESTKELWNEYGVKEINDEGQEILRVPEDKVEEFQAKMNQILDADIEVPCQEFKVEEFEFKAKNPEYSYTLLEDLFPED